MIALLADGHLLVEGAPGLAKTKAIKTLSEGLEADFHRVQFTPDLLPADITGSDIYRPQQGTFEFKRALCFTIWYLLMKLIEHRPKYSLLF